MTPREPDRYEEKARERAETLFVRVMGTMTSNKCIDLIYAALRREREATLNEAARDAETYCPLNASVSALVLAREIAVHIRALASPAAAPAAETAQEERHRAMRLRAYERDEEHAVQPSEPAADPIHEAYLAADEYGQPPSGPAAPAPSDLLPRVLAALEDPNGHGRRWSPVHLAAELRQYIAALATGPQPDWFAVGVKLAGEHEKRIAELEDVAARSRDEISDQRMWLEAKADEIDIHAKRIAELEALLKPFAAWPQPFSIEDVYRAQAALTRTASPGAQGKGEG